MNKAELSFYVNPETLVVIEVSELLDQETLDRYRGFIEMVVKMKMGSIEESGKISIELININGGKIQIPEPQPTLANILS